MTITDEMGDVVARLIDRSGWRERSEYMGQTGELYWDAIDEIRKLRAALPAAAPHVGVEEIARTIYESDKAFWHEDSGEYIDGFQVSPGGRISWAQLREMTVAGCIPFLKAARAVLALLPHPTAAPHVPEKEKIAPVQGYAAGIPWSMHLRAYDAYCKRYGPQQAMIDLEGRGCRGGFGTGELDIFIPGWREELSEFSRLRRQVASAHAQLLDKNNEIVELERQLAAPSPPAPAAGREAVLEEAAKVADKLAVTTVAAADNTSHQTARDRRDEDDLDRIELNLREKGRIAAEIAVSIRALASKPAPEPPK